VRAWKGFLIGATMAALAVPTLSAAQAADPVTVTILEHQQPRIDALNKIKPMCEADLAKQGMNVTLNIVDAQVADDSEFHTKLPILYQGDSPPDITSYPGAWVPDFATAGYLLDLTDKLNAWPDWNAHFYQILRDRAQQADGKYYSIPRGGTVMELFVRKDALEANGISTAQPNSWDELLTRLKEWKAKTNLPAITLPAGKQWGGGTFDEGFIHVFLGTGGQLYDDKTGKWIVKSPALNDAFGLYADLASNDLLPTQALLDPQPWTATKYDGFTGTTADGGTVPVAPPITTQGSWGWIYDWGPAPTGARPIPDLLNKVITWEFPSKAANDNFVWAAEDWMWTISAKTQHPNEAFAVLQCLNSGEPLATDISAVGNLAPRDDIQNVKPYADLPYLIAMEKLLPSGRSFKPQVGIDKIQQAVGDATEQLLLKATDGPGAAAAFAKEATDLLGADKVEEAPAQ
jgi:multiple sugar transport system substrate-binding protein